MVQENLEKIRTEDKKSYKKFLIVLIAAGLIGGFAGFFLSAGENFMTASGLSFVELWSDIQTGLVVPFRFITMIAGAVFWIISAIFYRKARKLWDNSEDQDEDYDAVEDYLNTSQVFSNIMVVVNFICFGISTYRIPDDKGPAWSFWAALLFFGLYVYGSFRMQHKVVNMVKEMNPEKQGSLYDQKFQKKWYASCDEAERRQIGIASYQTMQVTGCTCMGFMLAFLMLGMVIEIGLLPMLIPGVIWLVQVITYQISCKKAQKMLDK